MKRSINSWLTKGKPQDKSTLTKAFTDCSNDMQDVKKRKILIVFDELISDMMNNKKLNSVVTELFIRGGKLNISLVFITQDVRLNSTHFFIMKIPY